MERGTKLNLKSLQTFPPHPPAVIINRNYVGQHSAKLYLGILTLIVRHFPHLLEDNKHVNIRFVLFITRIENATLTALL